MGHPFSWGGRKRRGEVVGEITTADRPRHQTKLSGVDAAAVQTCRLVAKSNADGTGGANQLSVGIHRLEQADGVGHIHRNDGIAMQCNHHAEPSRSDQIDRGYAEACGQDAVKWGGRASALDVPQHADPNVLPRAVGERVSDQVADGTGAAILVQLWWKLHTFSQHHDGEVLADFFPLGDVPADMLDREGDLRDKDDVRATGEAGLKRDPAAVAPP